MYYLTRPIKSPSVLCSGITFGETGILYSYNLVRLFSEYMLYTSFVSLRALAQRSYFESFLVHYFFSN